MASETTETALLQLLSRFEAVQPYQISFGRGWARFAPLEAGVYCIYERQKPVYVGETGSLRGRMKDLRRTMNHTFRRSLGKALYGGHPEFQPATSKRRYSDSIELLLNEHMSASHLVRVMPVDFGRTEFEEFLIERYRPRFNQKLKRRV